MKNSIITLLIALITAMGFVVIKTEAMREVTGLRTYVFTNGASYYTFYHADGDKQDLIKDLEDIIVLLNE